MCFIGMQFVFGAPLFIILSYIFLLQSILCTIHTYIYVCIATIDRLNRSSCMSMNTHTHAHTFHCRLLCVFSLATQLRTTSTDECECATSSSVCLGWSSFFIYKCVCLFVFVQRRHYFDTGFCWMKFLNVFFQCIPLDMRDTRASAFFLIEFLLSLSFSKSVCLCFSHYISGFIIQKTFVWTTKWRRTGSAYFNS